MLTKSRRPCDESPVNSNSRRPRELVRASAVAIAALLGCARSPAPSPLAGHLRGDSVTIPCEVSDGIPYIRVRVVGAAEPLIFLLDSGASWTILDAKVARQLGLHVTADAGTLQGAGAGRVAYARVEEPLTLGFGDLESIGYHAIALPLSDGSSSSHRVDGIIGYDLLARYVVAVDYEHGRVSITDPASFHYEGRGRPLPIDFDGKWPRIPGRITVPGNPPLDDLFLVDSGSGDAVDHPLIEKSTEPLKEITTGVGLGQPIKGHLGRIESLDLAGYRLGRAPSACCSGTPRDDRVLGGEALRRFTVTFDYPEKRIFLEPNGWFGEAF
jgi:hypothetical protein